MARKTKQDVAKAKAAKQKKIAIVGAVLLVGLMAIQVPKMLKMMNAKPKPPIVSAPVGADPNATGTVTPADPNTLAAPTLGGTPTATATPTASATDLVSAVPVTADPGQLESFERFATKDPFIAQADASGAPASSGSSSGSSGSSTPKTPTGGGSGGGGSGSTPTTPTATTPTPPAPPAPAPSSAVISLNGELMSVGVATDFPLSGATFNRVGAIFHLVSLTAKTAKIAIVGGSYADGAPAITLKLKVPLTLQNTADGLKYTFILEPPGTPVTATATSGTTTTSVVPASGSGG